MDTARAAVKRQRSAVSHWGVVLAALVAIGVPAAAQADESAQGDGGNSGGIRVQRLVFPVNAAGGQYHAVGYMYCRGSCEGKVLQVLQHGATYNHTYWDAPAINGVSYSYARYMAQRNYAVLALDQLGSGESDVPNGDLLNLAECASVDAQVINQLRSGNNSEHYRFRKIVQVGHSMGAITGVYMQAVSHPADLLVVTGDFHVPRPNNLPPEVFAAMTANPYDRLDGPGRPFLFYSPPTADPAVEQYDIDHLADQVSRGLFLDVINTLADESLTRVQDVTGPVLEQVGEFDALFPETAGLEAQERATWTSTHNVTVQVVKNIGHDLNLHTNHLESWVAIDAWIRLQILFQEIAEHH